MINHLNDVGSDDSRVNNEMRILRDMAEDDSKMIRAAEIMESQHICSVAKAAEIEVTSDCFDDCARGISAGLYLTLSRLNIVYTDLFQLNGGILFPTANPDLEK